MRAPLRWLSEYVEVTLPADELAHRLTMAGAEVEEVIRTGASWEGIRVGRVLEVEPHPNADRLRLVTVDVADGEPHRVVCGAPNVAEGQTVAFAQEGARLRDAHGEPDAIITLKKAKIRGVESAGMVCSERELGLSDEHEGILVLDDALRPGTPLSEAIGETVLDITPTPNRPDHMSVLGIAREVAALTGQVVREPERTHASAGPAAAERVSVTIADPDLCPRYVATVVEGVTVGPSPEWLQAALRSAGQRPINNVVDVTNYVMLELGQPLHAFDLDRVAGSRIEVRRARAGESITLIDDSTHELTADMLLITDGAGPTAIAGVMGGGASEVTGETRNVLLEAANFDGPSIRRTSQALRLRTEASIRFEKGLNAELAAVASERAMRLLLETAGGTAREGRVDVYPGASRPVTVHVTRQRIAQVLGVDVAVEQVRGVLEGLGFSARWVPPDKYVVTAPYWRTDVTIPDDVVEEVGRILGYDTLPSAALAGAIPETSPAPALATREALRDALAAAGLHEAINYATSSDALTARVQPPESVWAEPALVLRNPMSAERASMRTSLRPALLETYATNARQARGPAAGPLGVFEIGKVFWPSGDDLPVERTLLTALLGGRTAVSPHAGAGDARAVDFFDAKAVAEAVGAWLGVTLRYAHALEAEAGPDPALTPGATARVSIETEGEPRAAGVVGEVLAEVADRFGIEGPVFLLELDVETLAAARAGAAATRAEAVNRYPAVSEDLAIVVDHDIPSAAVAAILTRTGLVEGADLFDVYTGDQVPAGKKSLAFAVRYRAPDRTLTEREVERARGGIVRQLERELGASLRA